MFTVPLMFLILLIWLVVLLIKLWLILPSPESSNDIFYDLPLGAVNGEWSAKAVVDGRQMSESIVELASNVSYVVRAEIIDKRIEVVNSGESIYSIPYMYSIYRLRVLDVYKGDIEINNIIEISQRKKRSFVNSGYLLEWNNTLIEYIRIPLEIGDDLILFLNFVEEFVSQGTVFSDMTNIWIFNRVQGVYRYTPVEIRIIHDNWVFEPVNPHNNLILTEEDLQQLRENRDNITANSTN